MKNTFKKNIIEFQEGGIKNYIPREYNIPINSKKIISLIGVRRCGKTSILFNIIKELQKTVDIENILYINFEDDRLFGLKIDKMDNLIEAYYELYPQKREEKVYFFLDEIQNIENWELFVRRIYDTLNIQIFITGSSSKLLSAEIATSLRGRTISYEIFPFSFKEYLRWKDIKVNLNSPKSLSFIKNALDAYLKEGGFPECIDEDKFVSRKIISEYINLIVYKDIIERYKLKNIDLLKHLIKYTFSNMGTLLSFNKLYNEFKSMGYKLSKDTLFDYFSYLEDGYITFKVPIHRNSVKEEIRNPKKIYAVDNVFKSIYDSSFSEDFSKLYENIVFLHLRRQTSEIYYFKQKQEVDFYAFINNNKILINVSYDLDNPKTYKREINGIIEGMKYFNIKESIIVTKDQESKEIIDDYIINIIPLYKFLLEVNF